jgi:hypothetical protein
VIPKFEKFRICGNKQCPNLYFLNL